MELFVRDFKLCVRDFEILVRGIDGLFEILVRGTDGFVRRVQLFVRGFEALDLALERLPGVGGEGLKGSEFRV